MDAIGPPVGAPWRAHPCRRAAAPKSDPSRKHLPLADVPRSAADAARRSCALPAAQPPQARRRREHTIHCAFSMTAVGVRGAVRAAIQTAPPPGADHGWQFFRNFDGGLRKISAVLLRRRHVVNASAEAPLARRGAHAVMAEAAAAAVAAAAAAAAVLSRQALRPRLTPRGYLRESRFEGGP